jgi:NAD-reducing hydrogenase small subunit
MRNFIPLEECLNESYISAIGIENAQIPNDPELPLLLDKVRPIHEVVKIDYFLPGCPPSADVFWMFLTDLIEGREPSLPYELVHYD